MRLVLIIPAKRQLHTYEGRRHLYSFAYDLEAGQQDMRECVEWARAYTEPEPPKAPA